MTKISECHAKETAHFGYINHRGVYSGRTVLPMRMYFGSTHWHQEMQWLLHAFDYERENYRDFAMKDIIKWEPRTEQRE